MSDETFYEQNAQCWRCRMYVPRVEMKYHAGMLYCPICYQDVAEAGGRCQLCGKQLEHGGGQVCEACREKKRNRCPECGNQMEEGVCPECSREEPGRHAGHGEGPSGEEGRPAGSGVVGCSRCRQLVQSPVWRNGQPYCSNCADKDGIFLPLVRRISGIAKAIVRPKAEKRLRVKASGKVSAEKEGDKREKAVKGREAEEK